MGNEGLNLYFLFLQEKQKGLHVSFGGPAHVPGRVIHPLLFVHSYRGNHVGNLGGNDFIVLTEDTTISRLKGASDLELYDDTAQLLAIIPAIPADVVQVTSAIATASATDNGNSYIAQLDFNLKGVANTAQFKLVTVGTGGNSHDYLANANTDANGVGSISFTSILDGDALQYAIHRLYDENNVEIFSFRGKTA